ncbi:MAG: LytTR family transcriptional regulator DNA-binding domain-containing protein [Bacteroides sp.]|jgi:hypothetical protein|nr:LytTR family transcriptional regulator DNA-binding domain-containing protein [Bacteroides sp.]
MLSNPVLYDKYIRQVAIVLCVLTGLAYAFAFGLPTHATAFNALSDGFLSAVLFFIVSALLWNVYTYSIPDSLDIYQRFLLQILYCLIALLFIAGLETLAVYLFFPDYLQSFALTLPSRLFALLMLYCVVHLYCQKNKQSEEELEEEEVEEEGCESLPEETEAVHEVLERITVKVGQKIKVIPVDELIYLKADDDYVSIVTADGHWLKNGTMKEYELCLPADKFARVHRSYIVNIAKIVRIERYGQKQLLQLSSGESLKISVAGYKILREKLNL